MGLPDDRLKPIVLKDLFGPHANFDALDWQPFKPGVEIYRLYGDQTSGPAAALLRYAPGGSVPVHEHTGYEHILILADAQADHHHHSREGTLIIQKPGSRHKVVSEGGCIVLAIWQDAVRIIPETEAVKV